MNLTKTVVNSGAQECLTSGDRVNSGGQECLTSSEQDFSYIQDKIKLNNTKKLYRN